MESLKRLWLDIEGIIKYWKHFKLHLLEHLYSHPPRKTDIHLHVHTIWDKHLLTQRYSSQTVPQWRASYLSYRRCVNRQFSQCSSEISSDSEPSCLRSSFPKFVFLLLSSPHCPVTGRCGNRKVWPSGPSSGQLWKAFKLPTHLWAQLRRVRFAVQPGFLLCPILLPSPHLHRCGSGSSP